MVWLYLGTYLVDSACTGGVGGRGGRAEDMGYGGRGGEVGEGRGSGFG